MNSSMKMQILLARIRSDWEKHFFLQKLGIKPMRIVEMNDKESDEEKEETEEEITLAKALETVDKLKT